MGACSCLQVEKMNELMGLYAIWERELKVYLRERSRLIASIINPLFWLLIFGGGLGARVRIEGVNYQTFIYPGIIVMSMLFTSIFYGAYVVWDRRLDFLKEVLVAPIRRVTIFFGKVLGGVTDCLIQVSILIVLAPLFQIPIGLNFILVYLAIIIAVIGLVSIGLIIGSIMESPEGFGLIVSFINFPLFFLSGALFPLEGLPSWLGIATKLNPVSYAVDAIRGLMLGSASFTIGLDFLVISSFAIVMVFLGSFFFNRMRV